jgi:hypothetical protein
MFLLTRIDLCCHTQSSVDHDAAPSTPHRREIYRVPHTRGVAETCFTPADLVAWRFEFEIIPCVICAWRDSFLKHGSLPALSGSETVEGRLQQSR